MASIVNERYANSLYQLALEDDKTVVIMSQFETIVQAVMQAPEFLDMLSAPSIAFAEKAQVIKKCFEGKVDIYMLNFLLLITEKRRVAGLIEMQQAYKMRYYDDNGVCEVKVTTAIALNGELEQKMQAKLEKITGKKVVMIKNVDASILGGVVLEVGTQQIDTSVQTRLQDLAHKMTQIIA